MLCTTAINTSNTVYRSVHPFSHSAPVCPTHRRVYTDDTLRYMRHVCERVAFTQRMYRRAMRSKMLNVVRTVDIIAPSFS